ncbi:hypothetical protein EPI10_014279 [Gossypium australe]|uniref:Uncharacterized protein n=1 Tax=Gossypium australe TaxID=47621 RepID=A0A5B6VGT9_9ROSI|nr:hypothetical protein EPI10_014279 [Gossypium australe]
MATSHRGSTVGGGRGHEMARFGKEEKGSSSVSGLVPMTERGLRLHDPGRFGSTEASAHGGCGPGGEWFGGRQGVVGVTAQELGFQKP